MILLLSWLRRKIMKSNLYYIEHILDDLYRKGYTKFLTRKELMDIKRKLRKNAFFIYELYEDSSKVILYQKEVPTICLVKIVCKGLLRHQDIMGAIFSLGIHEDTFGDIVFYRDSFYLFLLPYMVEYFTYHLVHIRNQEVRLEKVDLSISNYFKQEYMIKEFIVSSLRIDNVVSTIVKDSRRGVLEKFKNKEVLLNYEEEIKPTRLLKVGDVFSIRRLGKYKFDKILKETKKGGYVILIFMYV